MSDDPEPFVLSLGERQSPLWLRLQAHFTSRLEHYRSKNDGPLTQEQTLTIRGRIEFAKEFLALGKEPPNIDG